MVNPIRHAVFDRGRPPTAKADIHFNGGFCSLPNGVQAEVSDQLQRSDSRLAALRTGFRTAGEIDELHANYFALLSLCDDLRGRFLDYFDAHDMWKDTALILTTDHGFLLGEHDWWAKNRMPLYEKISHIPLFVYHPDHAGKGGQRRQNLTQTIDLMPTICELFGAEFPPEVQGKSLLPLLERDQPQLDAAMFGYWGGGVNIVDGRYTWFCYPKDMVPLAHTGKTPRSRPHPILPA